MKLFLDGTLKYNNTIVKHTMAAKKSESGLMSSAGLMRYFDSEETKMLFTPKTVVSVSIAIAITLLALNAHFGLWP